MLQQTTVAAVTPRFERFVRRWPTIEALAAADDSDVLSEWAGLGYYARARNLIACARAVAKRGGFPTESADLRTLPGIGGYTSAAIAAIAFGEDAAAVDTNVERVIARLNGLERPDRSEVEQLMLAMIPAGRSGDFAQAMMDLGATICRPKAPRCSHCPLRPDCAAYSSGKPEAFPASKMKAARPLKHGVVWWIERDDQIWLVRRPPTGLLGGMAALPGTDWSVGGQSCASPLGIVRHTFTHFALELSVERRPGPVGEGWWERTERLDRVGLPTLYRKAANLALAARSDARRAA